MHGRFLEQAVAVIRPEQMHTEKPEGLSDAVRDAADDLSDGKIARTAVVGTRDACRRERDVPDDLVQGAGTDRGDHA